HLAERICQQAHFEWQVQEVKSDAVTGLGVAYQRLESRSDNGRTTSIENVHADARLVIDPSIDLEIDLPRARPERTAQQRVLVNPVQRVVVDRILFVGQCVFESRGGAPVERDLRNIDSGNVRRSLERELEFD